MVRERSDHVLKFHLAGTKPTLWRRVILGEVSVFPADIACACFWPSSEDCD